MKYLGSATITPKESKKLATESNARNSFKRVVPDSKDPSKTGKMINSSNFFMRTSERLNKSTSPSKTPTAQGSKLRTSAKERRMKKTATRTRNSSDRNIKQDIGPTGLS